ncbi:MAG: putative bifunctional diguanylate cyclase/phosphodiesterase [Steroidobacteraceae bacterium]
MVRPHSFGITTTLALTFAAVAVLAVAANLIVQEGILVIQTTRIQTVVAPAPATVPASNRSTSASRSTPAGPAPRVTTTGVLLAIERFEHATQDRGSIDSPETEARFGLARSDLDKFWSKAQAKNPSASGHPLNNLSANVAAFIDAATVAVRSQDMRRALLAEYTAHLDAMTLRLQTSQNREWKIFGHVLARQSLRRLQDDLDAIRRSFAGLNAADAGAGAKLGASELNFAKTLNDNESSFSRSDGRSWVRDMRNDLERIVELRRSLVDSGSQGEASMFEFLELGTALGHAIEKAFTMDAAPAQADQIAQRDQEAPVPPSAANSLPAPNPTGGAITTTTTRAQDSGGVVVAWITGVVLALLLAISIITVRSIVLPVRRMLQAADRLAVGDVDARVPRGGIKELDTLAIGFNRMAAQLAAAGTAAQEYQRKLETTVEQRTRELQHLAEHDPLTLLPNRRQLLTLLSNATERAARTQRSVGVLFIDVDNFKYLNDSLGHTFGDHVLVAIGRRLQAAALDVGFAARWGGDEFALVYEDAHSQEAVERAGWALVDAFREPILVRGREVSVSVSVGASLFPDHEIRAEDLLSAADAALFNAKALGRSQLAMFTPALLAAATSKFTTEQGLRRAIERAEFELVYQPEVSLESMEINVVEALIRWRLPDGRQAPPAEFLSIAEESGLIHEIGNWVLRDAIRTASGWHYGAWPDVRVAINVSPRQLMDNRFVDQLRGMLEEFRLPPQCIELELTESVLQTGSGTIDSLRRLRDCRIAIALDDFGTGYSSLASLEKLPLSRIKLDRSLIAGIDTSTRAAAIASAIIDLCSNLNLAVTAEGVERREQFALLSGGRPISVQGYLLSRPVSSTQVLGLRANMNAIVQDIIVSLRSSPPQDAAVSLFDAQRKRRSTPWPHR